ncbi:hypothetical protein H7X46_22055 [Pseudonocardia sp. C8]|uniref:hypothetical protein n=1 Tax=Pseudonocardia sp. C8 TaxID=2762759 RepID=UPI001642F9AF|nr:hypothetical protein [Pseudonocardia sp. C8]MBC3193747.1 hypothetical protein [Pseudonocardia sp. C8]
MQELVDRLTALDPEAGESLKVVAYFDALVLSGAGLDALLRGAAALSGAIAGAERHGRVTRRSPDGRSAPEPATVPRSPESTYSAGTVWLERETKPHARDAMIVERLALAVGVLESRRDPTGDLEVVLDPEKTIDERTKALARLHVDAGSRVRVIATHPRSGDARSALTTLVPTRYGIVRATLCRGDTEPPSTPAGIGQWVAADHAPESWQGALISLQVIGDDRPVLDAELLGVLLPVALACDPESPHDDVRALARLDARSAHILQILVEADSLRSAAATLGMHHSSIQAKHESLTRELGYDPRTITGRIRYGIAELYRRLTDPRVLP